MQKTLLIFLGILAVGWTASLGATGDDPVVCKYEDELWGGEDIRKFYFCIDGQVIEDWCDKDCYFVNNATFSGCLQANLLNPQCVNLDAAEPDCKGLSAWQPQPSASPNNFYLCTSEGAKELSCEQDKAFVNQDGYLGCFTWTTWRMLRNCTDD
ncbi:uncharacterized protein LOC117896867 [Drosophila subobscura]|uniref:uncharacterized protein LOC117896867 n=1 Tax=Drosophila subobscura TaxID=7241 RepID=UPI00155B0EB6|nr:uncharacterized protein LOC117896867 [Drosophila subobscura]